MSNSSNEAQIINSKAQNALSTSTIMLEQAANPLGRAAHRYRLI